MMWSMRRSRRRLWGLLILIVVAPATFYGLHAVLRGATTSRSPMSVSAAIILPTPEPRGPTPAVTLAPPVPSPREQDAMAFDAVHNDVVMKGGGGFGTGAGDSSRETWVFDARARHRPGWRSSTEQSSQRGMDVGWHDLDEARRLADRRAEPCRNGRAACARGTGTRDRADQRGGHRGRYVDLGGIVMAPGPLRHRASCGGIDTGRRVRSR